MAHRICCDISDELRNLLEMGRSGPFVDDWKRANDTGVHYQDQNTLLRAELDRQRAINAELVAALQALLDGRPTEEPPTIAKIAHRNWELFEQARAALTKAGAA